MQFSLAQSGSAFLSSAHHVVRKIHNLHHPFAPPFILVRCIQSFKNNEEKGKDSMTKHLKLFSPDPTTAK